MGEPRKMSGLPSMVIAPGKGSQFRGSFFAREFGGLTASGRSIRLLRSWPL